MRKSVITAAIVTSLTLGSAAQAANIVETAQSAGMFGTLITAVKAAGPADALSTRGNLTVFAPTDKAFATLPDGVVEDLLKPENKAKLAVILSYHVLPRKLASNQLPTSWKLTNGGQF